MPAASAMRRASDTGRRCRPRRFRLRRRRSPIAESAARSWCPRNDGCRQPAFQASNTSSAEELESPRPPRRPRTRARVRREGSSGPACGGRAGARRRRAAHTPELQEARRGERRTGRRRATPGGAPRIASHASSAVPDKPEGAAGRRRSTPSRIAARTATTTTTSTATSERRMSTVVEPAANERSGWKRSWMNRNGTAAARTIAPRLSGSVTSSRRLRPAVIGSISSGGSAPAGL